MQEIICQQTDEWHRNGERANSNVQCKRGLRRWEVRGRKEQERSHREKQEGRCQVGAWDH